MHHHHHLDAKRSAKASPCYDRLPELSILHQLQGLNRCNTHVMENAGGGWPTIVQNILFTILWWIKIFISWTLFWKCRRIVSGYFFSIFIHVALHNWSKTNYKSGMAVPYQWINNFPCTLTWMLNLLFTLSYIASAVFAFRLFQNTCTSALKWRACRSRPPCFDMPPLPLLEPEPSFLIAESVLLQQWQNSH